MATVVWTQIEKVPLSDSESVISEDLPRYVTRESFEAQITISALNNYGEFSIQELPPSYYPITKQFLSETKSDPMRFLG
jgi:hypothetical protein